MKVVISGLGVMGASLAQAIKNSNFKADIWGYDQDDIVNQARNLNIIDTKVKDWPADCKDADLVFLATPPNVPPDGDGLINAFDSAESFSMRVLSAMTLPPLRVLLGSTASTATR